MGLVKVGRYMLLMIHALNWGISKGQLTLRNLRLKKGALDKFRLPVDVLEGERAPVLPSR